MQIDPVQEWRRLTEHYRAMTDDRIEELAADFADLTDAAQQILRGEMRSRGLGDPQARPAEPKCATRISIPRPDSAFDSPHGALPLPHGALPLLTSGDSEPAARTLREYTWKTLLCECEEPAQASQLGEVLRRAGIESWIEGPRAGGNWELRYHRLLVAADELDQARELVSTPIPQDILDQSRDPAREFEPPKCPGCGAADAVLENIEPVNAWHCESCGKQWVDLAQNRNEEQQKEGP